jgi:hypothetical protein
MQQSLSSGVGQASRLVGLPNTTTQERWSTRVRKHITAVSKGVSEILAALSEPFMRYSTIYLALATSIPVVKWMPLYTLCQGIVIAAPEFVLLGALSIAEQACKGSQKTWGVLLYMVSILLACIMIATFVDIFIVTFSPLAVQCLNFARCLVAVGFSVVLGKLEKGDDEDAGTGSPSMASVSPTAPSSTPPTVPAPVPPSKPAPVSIMASEVASIGANGEKQDKLTLALDFLRIHPERANAPDADTQLAEILGLKRPASARFWRLKAMEMIEAETIQRKTSLDRDARLSSAFEKLSKEGKNISGRALAEEAKANRKATTEWLRLHHPEMIGTENTGSGSALSMTSGATSELDENQEQEEALTGTDGSRFHVVR